MAESIGPMGLAKQKQTTPEVGSRLPLAGPGASVTDATEGARLGSSSAMSSGQLSLDRLLASRACLRFTGVFSIKQSTNYEKGIIIEW